jgi:hypothetical protein
MEQILRYLRLPELMTHADGTAVTRESWQRRRGELLYDLQRYAYGFLPPEPLTVREKARVGYDSGWGRDGKAHTRVEWIELELIYPNGIFTFPFKLIRPTDVETPPLLVTIGMSLEGIFAALPPEGFVQKGIAVAALATNDITADAWPFDDGICKLLWPEGHGGADAGKLLIWGRCMGYVMHDLLASGEFDETRVGCAGCSRFGKTAMVAGAFDEGFTHVISVCSGCGGASLLRGKIGETVADITGNYGYWFNDAFKSFWEDVDALPVDAHFLAAAVAPRKLLICSAYEDFWCDPFHEQLTCIAASPAWEIQGLHGFVYPEPKGQNPGPRYAKIGEKFFDGEVCYSLREGGHGMPQEDWDTLASFLLEK